MGKEELHGGDLKAKDKLPLPSKRPSKKKPKDKPKRPLSVKEEREKILKVVLAEDPEKVENPPDSEDYLDDAALKKLRKEGGKVSFEEMGKLIGQRWKNIDADRLSRFSDLAAEDTERYKKEMADYNGRQELKMRNEALKPASSMPRSDRPMPGSYEMNGMSSAFANAASMGGGYYGGMEFGGYPTMGMGMGGMYAPYGGYPPMGPGGGGGGAPEGMPPGGGGRMDPNAQYGGPPGMYGMMGPQGFQGMMGYGGQGVPEGYPQGQQPPMDPGQQGMYGYPPGWGQQ